MDCAGLCDCIDRGGLFLGKKAQIIGGHLMATEEICARKIGSPGGGTETILEVGISHVKKGDKDYDKGDIPDEGDLIGSYSGGSSAAAIFFLSRNKMSDDPIIRNTTIVTTPKIRWTGRTGVVDKVFFDQETRRLHNFNDYFSGKSDVGYIPPTCLQDDVVNNDSDENMEDDW